MGAMDLTSGARASTRSTLPTEPSSQPQLWFYIYWTYHWVGIPALLDTDLPDMSMLSRQRA